MILTHAIFQSHNMHVGIWKNKKHATNWFQKNTCKDVGNQAIMGDRQNMRPSFLPQLLLRSKCASGLLTFCLAWEPEDSCKDTLDVRNRREWGTDKTCAPSSFLAFTQKQLGLQSPCFLPHMRPRRSMQGEWGRCKTCLLGFYSESAVPPVPLLFAPLSYTTAYPAL